MGLISNTEVSLTKGEESELNHFILTFRLKHNKNINIECTGTADGSQYSLQDLKVIVDKMFFAFRQGIVHSDGIFYPTRRYGYPLFRSFFYLLAVNEGYREAHIGKFAQYNRATVAHGVTTVKNLIETGDKLTVREWSKIQEFMKKDKTP